MHRAPGTSALLAAAIAAVAAVHACDAVAEEKPLKKVRIAVGTSLINVGYPMLTLPGPLGYWKAEGYDVELFPAGASLQAVQQVVAGNADFAEVNASVIVQANARNNLPVRVVSVNGVIDWALAVNADGGIKSAKDLKGKTVGVLSLATGGIAYLNNFLRANGLDPARDVELVPLGLGAPPVEAMRSGKVHALLYWAAAIATFENAGLKLTKLVGDDWRSYPDYSLAAMQATLDRDPDMAVGIARGVAKGTVYALANPDCARRLQWQNYPSTRPSGADEPTLIRWDMNTQQAQLDSLADGFKLNGGRYWGAVDPAALDRLVKLMLEARQIDKPVAAASMMTTIPGLVARVNEFDVKTVEADARACKGLKG